MRLRRLNEAGVMWFRAQLAALRANPGQNLELERLEDPELTVPVEPIIQVEKPDFETKRDAAVYLGSKLKPLDSAGLFDDAGLWAWLALLYFDLVCRKRSGRRKVLADPHYIVDPDFRRRYRHLLATPVRVLWTIPKYNALFLDAPLDTHGEMMEQLMSRLYVMRIPAVAEAAELLYFDRETGKRKRGVFPTTPQRGDLRSRFPIRLRQLGLTYDLAAVSGAQLVDLLGTEFQRWLTRS